MQGSAKLSTDTEQFNAAAAKQQGERIDAARRLFYVPSNITLVWSGQYFGVRADVNDALQF